ncbi:hypothetical protein DPMN_141682 [Dreissena polymorpha]|uniref:Uncharacterized protein n=1 Tax=Dreissena polymorpha TaxID=45954 RepID=A0A9D4JII9_DREPO|nr:hypothetical protein DPMN_141682 [Dreissena polymorpha]
MQVDVGVSSPPASTPLQLVSKSSCNLPAPSSEAASGSSWFTNEEDTLPFHFQMAWMIRLVCPNGKPRAFKSFSSTRSSASLAIDLFLSDDFNWLHACM